MSQTTAIPGGQDRPGDVRYQIAARTAAVAGIFSLVVCVLLLYDYSHRRADDPAEAVAFVALRAALAAQPDNEQLREQIRIVDVQLRKDYFRQRAFSVTGAWLLLGGMVVFLIAAKSAARLRRKLPTPGPQTTPRDVETEMARTGRWSVAVLAVVLIGVVVGLSVSLKTLLPRGDEQLAAPLEPGAAGPQAKPPALSDTPPSADEIRQAWPRFRGPGGLGISAYTDVPEAWDGTSGDGILWKTPVPLPGHNSPVVWQQRVFLSGATEESREVYCFDANSGKLLWQKKVPPTPQGTSSKPLEIDKGTGYAAPTTATDGRRVYASFVNGDVAAFDFHGNLAWTRGLGIPDNSYGHASSLTTFENLLLVQFDQGGPKDKKSKFLALDVATGKTRWQADREMPNSWSTPIVIHHAGRDQIITAAAPWVIAYDPADGAEIWRAKCLSQDVGPSPTFADGVVYVANEFPQATAIRADGEGDVTETPHVLWTAEDGLPDTCSPLATKEHLYLLASYGRFTCYDVKQGELLWEQDFDATFTSSPSLVGKRLYLFGEIEEKDEKGEWVQKGKTWIVEPGPQQCEIVGEYPLGEGCVTSPAFQQGRIYIRGREHLFCIGRP